MPAQGDVHPAHRGYRCERSTKESERAILEDCGGGARVDEGVEAGATKAVPSDGSLRRCPDARAQLSSGEGLLLFCSSRRSRPTARPRSGGRPPMYPERAGASGGRGAAPVDRNRRHSASVPSAASLLRTISSRPACVSIRRSSRSGAGALRGDAGLPIRVVVDDALMADHARIRGRITSRIARQVRCTKRSAGRRQLSRTYPRNGPTTVRVQRTAPRRSLNSAPGTSGGSDQLPALLVVAARVRAPALTSSRALPLEDVGHSAGVFDVEKLRGQ